MKLEQVLPELRKEGTQISHAAFTSPPREGETEPILNAVIQKQAVNAFGEPAETLVMFHRGGAISQFNFSSLPVSALLDNNWFVVSEKGKSKK